MKNKNSRIIHKIGKGKYITKTHRRDDKEFDIEVVTSDGATEVSIDAAGFLGDTLFLNGREARTLYRALRKHYESIGKSY